MCRLLGAELREIPISECCLRHFGDIGHDPAERTTTYENVQARERTQILMDLANKTGGLVVGTGDLSEIALGWSTYNGDHMSMYAVNCSIPKTLIRCLIEHIAGESSPELAATLADINNTPVSPELLPPSGDGSIEQRTGALRPARFFPLPLHQIRGRAGQNPVSGGARLPRRIPAGLHPPLPGHLHPPLLPAAIQAQLHAGRPQGRHHCPFSARRLAHAFRRLRNSVGKRYFPPLNPSGGLLHADLLRRPGMNCPTGKLNAREPVSSR